MKKESCIPARYMLTFLGFAGFLIMYTHRVNLNVTILAMVKGSITTANSSLGDECPPADTVDAPVRLQEGEFLWNEYDQGVILGAFYYGYVILQIPGGRLAERMGGKWFFGLGVLVSSILTLLTPVAARLDKWALIAVRFLIGLGQGTTYPAMHVLSARRIPKSERALLTTIIYSGSLIGSVVGMPVSAILSDSKSLGGWPSTFYLFGILGCVWFGFWITCTHETPTEQHKEIINLTLDETSYILENQDNEQTQMKAPIPWLKILSSTPVWVLMLTHFGHNWGFYMLLTDLPTYMKNILHFDLSRNGFLSAIPFLLQAIFSWVSAYGADLVHKKKYVSKSFIRKFCNTVAFIGPALCILGVTFSRCDATLTVTLLAASMAINGFCFPGFMVTHIDMSPDFAGTLMGMTNCFGNFAGFLTPIAVGALTQDNETLHQWGLLFYITIAIYVLTSTLFVVFGSAELQPWGLAQTENVRENNPLK